MLEIPATHNSVLNEPAQPHQQQSIIVEESSKKLEFGIAASGDGLAHQAEN